MPATGNFAIFDRKTKKSKGVKFYAIFFPNEPEKSTIVTSWIRASALLKGKKNFQKSFPSENEAKTWMNIMNMENSKTTSIVTVKESARSTYPEVFGRAKETRKAIYYTDCSYTPGKYCAVGVWSPTAHSQSRYPYDPVTTTHQRGELLGLFHAMKNAEKFLATNDLYTGACIFTDSHYSEQTVNNWVPNIYLKQKDTAHLWRNSRNNLVKHQDVIREIELMRRQFLEKGKYIEIHFIPRELNSFADAVSRGEKIIRVKGKYKVKAVSK